MRFVRPALVILSGGVLGTVLAACTSLGSQVHQGLGASSSQADHYIEAAKQAPSKPTKETANPYLGPSTPVLSSPQPVLPAVFDSSFDMSSANPVSLGEIAAVLNQTKGIQVFVEADAVQTLGAADGGRPTLDGQINQAVENGGATAVQGGQGVQLPRTSYRMPVLYHGTVDGFLNMITARANVFWRWDPDMQRVDIFRTRTRHFDIRALAGAYNYELSLTNQSGTQNTTGNGQAGGSTGGVSGSSSAIEQTSVKTATLDAWQSIQNSVKAMLSPDGKLATTDVVGSLTVRDTPPRLQAIARYVAEQNTKLSRQVEIRVDVIDVTLDHAAQYGIDWNAVYHKAGSWGLNLVTNNINGNIGNTLSGSVLSTSSRFSTTQALLAALNTVGDASIATSETISTQNGMPAPVRVGRQDNYIASSQTNSSVTIGQSVSVVQATVTSGVSMMLLPFIEDNNNILVQLDLDITNLTGFDNNNVDGINIKTPHETLKNLIDRLNVKSGQTVLISGFQQIQDEHDYTGTAPEGHGLFGWLGALFGGVDSKTHQKQTTVVLITPYLVGS